MGLRDVVILLIVLLVAYLTWVLVRAWRLGRRKSAVSAPAVSTSAPRESQVERSISDSLADEDDGDAHVTLSSFAARDDVPTQVLNDEPPRDMSFDSVMELRQLRQSVEALKRDCTVLQDEVGHLRENLQKLTSEVRAASRVSPQYGEAVGLARKGWDAQAIAERCGISVAEAELVRTLSEISGGGDEANG